MQTEPLYRANFKEATNISAVESMDELKALIDILYNSDNLIGFDIETGYSGADFPKRAPNVYHPNQFTVGFSITNDPTWARYVPLRHDFANNLDPNEVWPLMKPLLEEKVGVSHNLLFECENMRALDVKGDGPRIEIPVAKWHDSMIQAFLLSDVPPMRIDGSLREGEFVKAYLPPFHRTDDLFPVKDLKWFNVGLKDLTRLRYNYNQNDIFSLFNGGKELTQRQKEAIRFNTLPVDPTVVRYACDDAYLCLMLHMDQHQRLMEDPYLGTVYKLEMQVAEVLADMKEVGVAVDWEGLKTQHGMFKNFLQEMRINTKEKFEAELGRELINLNLNSPVQVRKLIFGSKDEGGMGLMAERTTATGLASTDDKSLVSLRKSSPAIDSLLILRQCVLMGKWLENWCKLENQALDGRVHPSFNQVRIQSGRFASSGPNVQQVTKRWWFQNIAGSVADVMRTGTQGKDFWTGNARDFIVASPGFTLLSFDYKSAEIQFLAALAQEVDIIQAFINDEDFHTWTASLAFNTPQDKVTKAQRQAAKAVAFGSIYGQSEAALAQQLGIPLKEAQEIREMFFSRFPKLARYFEDQHEMVNSEAEVRTWMGRKATIWEAMHPSRKVRSKAERMSVNIPVQGGATGDYTKLAMVKCFHSLKKKGWWGTKVRLLMNQHDSLVFEVSNDLDLQEVIAFLTEQVQFTLAGYTGGFNEFRHFPPMGVDWEAGLKWGSIDAVDGLPYLDATKIDVIFADNATRDDLDAVRDVLVTNPGPVPVSLKIRDKSVDKYSVTPHYSLLSKLRKGDPDIGIRHTPGNKVSVKFWNGDADVLLYTHVKREGGEQ